MRSRLVPALAAGALTFSLLGPVSASADDPVSLPSVDGPGVVDGTAAERASEVLDEALALRERPTAAESRQLRAEGGRDATMVLNQLVRVRADLSPEDRARADRLLARPTAPGGDGTADYGDAPHTSACGDTVCIHYVTDPEDPNAPDLTDGDDENDVPDSVDAALAEAESINATYVDAGYRRPDSDGTRGGTDEALVDIYLAQLADQEIYGYCTVDNASLSGPANRAAYCAIDNDFEEFPTNTPAENRRVTLAHEYFHAVQFAYDFFEDPWIMEATATWAEDELFDGVDDNLQYLPDSQLKLFYSPLDRFAVDNNMQYGNWIFIRYLTEQWPAREGDLPVIVKQVWQQLSARSGAPVRYSTQALQKVLADRGTSFTNTYGRFADANRRAAKTYDEGSAYARYVASPARTWTVSAKRRQVRGFYAELDHLTNFPLRYRVGSSLRKADWKLKLTVDPPPSASAPVVRVTVYKKNGRVAASSLRLRNRGASSKVVPFTTRSVKYVELVLVNASRRMRCGRASNFDASYYACYGKSVDNNRRFDFNVKAFRR